MTPEEPDTLAAWLRHCELSHPSDIDLTLDRVQTVKDRLGLSFRVPVIMVAGTNGKGSTCALLESIAHASGWRVGLYSKPHLVHFEERCRLGCESVDAAQLVPHFRAVEAARGDTPLTYFEFTTLAILSLLSTADLDLVVLEVGLGGRHDAVNIIDADVSVITAIDLDHREYLGNTRDLIALEKAGIMRPLRPAVIADLEPPKTLLRHGQRVGARLRLVGRDFLASGLTTDCWTWSGGAAVLASLPMPALLGPGQLQNAAAALAALDALAEDGKLPAVQRPDVALGLRSVRLRGRFEIIRREPHVVLDVAHNVHSVRNMLASKQAHLGKGRTLAVFGCMRDKDIDGMLQEASAMIDRWYFTDLPTRRAETAPRLLERLERGGRRVEGLPPGDVSGGSSCWSTPCKALAAAMQDAGAGDTVLVFGSFYTVGAVLEGGNEVSIGDVPRSSVPRACR